MKEVAQMIRNHFEGILAWVTSRQTNGFLEAINGLYQAAKRKARGYVRFRSDNAATYTVHFASSNRSPVGVRNLRKGGVAKSSASGGGLIGAGIAKRRSR